MPSQEQIDQEANGSDLEQRVRTLEDTIATLRRNLLEATMTRPGTMQLTPSLYISPNGLVARQFLGQYTLENLGAEFGGAPPVGNEDMDIVPDGVISILDISNIAGGYPPRTGAAWVWVPRNVVEPNPLPNTQPTTQSYIYGLATYVPNGNLTNMAEVQMGSRTPNYGAFVRTHTSEYTGQDPLADVAIYGSLRFPHNVMAQITADQNNYQVNAGLYTVVTLTSDAARNITGLVVPRQQATSFETKSQAILILINKGSFNITLKNNSGSSSANNRFLFDADVVLKPNQGCILSCDFTADAPSNWRALAYPVTAGGVATDAIWDNKGDLAVGTGADTAQRLAVGQDGARLAADSGAATGVAWKPFFGDVTSLTGSGSASLSANHHYVRLSSLTGNYTVNLNHPQSAGEAHLIKRYDTSGFTVTIDGNTTDTIDGSLTITLAPYESALLIWDGSSNWERN